MIKKKLQEEQIKALKNKKTVKLNVIRYILSKIKNEEIDKKRELIDEEIIEIIKKILQQNKETQIFAGKKNDSNLLRQLDEEKKILTSFLPNQLTKDQLKEEIKKIIDKNQELYKKNPKAIIGITIKQLKIRSNPADILQILNENYGIN